MQSNLQLLPLLENHISLYRLSSCIKSTLKEDGLGRVFIFGVLPYPLVKNSFGCGLDIATYLTLDPTYSALCGFTYEELKYKLESIRIENKIDIEIDIEILMKEYGGYSFSRIEEENIKVCNSFLCLQYLKQRITRKKMKFDDCDMNILSPSSSTHRKTKDNMQ
jgi:hypothetical protein